MADGVLLEVAGIHSGYAGLEILHGVDLDVRAGEFVCLLGPNGAGKSTLLRTIFGMCRITAGAIRYDGRELSRLRPRDILALGVPYVPQGRCNFPLMTVAENLEMALYGMRDRDELGDHMRYVYETFPMLEQRRQQIAGSLSGGEQQVLEIGMALLRRPRLLLIDEPSMGLAPQAIGWVFREMQRLHERGVAVLLVEQNTRKAMEVAQRVIVMRLGRIAWTGAPDSITERQLGELFLTGRLPPERA